MDTLLQAIIFLDGLQAAGEGTPQAANPHPALSATHGTWSAGWDQGCAWGGPVQKPRLLRRAADAPCPSGSDPAAALLSRPETPAATRA